VLIPTPRLLLLVLAGAVPIVLTATHAVALLVAGVWLLGAIVMALVDGLSIDLTGLRWQREHDPKLSLGASNRITLTLTNNTSRVIDFQARDTIPALLQAQGERLEGRCVPGGSWFGHYHVRPMSRGEYHLEAVTARYAGPLRLVWRQRVHRWDDTARVYPNLLALGQFDALVRRGQLQELGLRNARRWGTGTEFERLREYTPDDEYRRISWKATARRRAPVVVDYETERSQNVVVLIDSGRLMGTKLPLRGGDAEPYGAQALTRLDHAINAALMISYVSEGVGDRVGLLTFGDGVQRFLPPRAGRGHFLRIADALYDVREEPTEPDFSQALGYLSGRVSRRSLVVMFTDISSPETGQALARALTVMARRHLCVTVTLRDPALEELAEQPLNGLGPAYERAVAQLWLDERATLLRRLRSMGVLTVDTSADAISTDVVNRYLEVKGRGSL
jgi:uncharacterized protein (DUF58 family)